MISNRIACVERQRAVKILDGKVQRDTLKLMIFELTPKGNEGPRQKEVQNIDFQQLKQQVKRL